MLDSLVHVVDAYTAFSLPCDDGVCCRYIGLSTLQGVPRSVEASCLWRNEVHPPSCDLAIILLSPLLQLPTFCSYGDPSARAAAYRIPTETFPFASGGAGYRVKTRVSSSSTSSRPLALRSALGRWHMYAKATRAISGCTCAAGTCLPKLDSSSS
jgi:hypothetical protein